MQADRLGGMQPPSADVTEVRIGAARIGAALLNTSTDPLTHIPDHTGACLSGLAEAEDCRQSELYQEQGAEPRRQLAAADIAEGEGASHGAMHPIQRRPMPMTRAGAAARAAETMESQTITPSRQPAE